MTDSEFNYLAGAIRAAYPNTKILSDIPSMKFWFTMLKDLDAKVCENALMEYVSTNVFPPTIADIRKLCVQRTEKASPPFDEAWGSVVKAIGKYGSAQPQKAYESLDEMTREVVKNLGWTNICMSDNLVSSRANFREAYEKRVAEANTRKQLPKFVEQTKYQLIGKHVPDVQALEDKAQDIDYVTAPKEKRGQLPPAGMLERFRREMYGEGNK